MKRKDGDSIGGVVQVMAENMPIEWEVMYTMTVN